MTPDQLAKHRALFFYEQLDFHDQICLILNMCGLTQIVSTNDITDAVNHLITGNLHLILLAYNEESDLSRQFLQKVKGLDFVLPIIAITKEGLDTHHVLDIFMQGVDEVIWPPLSPSKLSRFIEQALSGEADSLQHRSYKAAEVCLNNGDLDRAFKIYSGLLEKNIFPAESHLGLSYVHVLRGNTDQAKQHLSEAHLHAKEVGHIIRRTYLFSRIVYCYGELSRRMGRLDDAVTYYNSALSMNPHHTDALLALVDTLSALDRVEEIFTLGGEVKKTLRPYSEPYNKIAQSLFERATRLDQLGMQQKAERFFTYLQSFPHAATPIHLAVYDFSWRHRQHTTTIANLTSLVERLPEAPLQSRLGNYLLAMAVQLLQQKGKTESPSGGTGTFMGQRPSALIGKAIQYSQEALSKNYQLHEAWLNLIRGNLCLGKQEQAIDLLEKYAHNGTISADNLSQVIELLFEEDAYPVSLPYLQQGQQQYPQDGRFYLLQARYFHQEGDGHEAIGTLKQGLQHCPNDAKLAMMLGDLYLEKGQAAEAVVFLERAAKYNPADAPLKAKLTQALLAKRDGGRKRRSLFIKR